MREYNIAKKDAIFTLLILLVFLIISNYSVERARSVQTASESNFEKRINHLNTLSASAQSEQTQSY